MAGSAPQGSYDAVVVGAGPNGLAAAIRLAQSGLSVVTFEANETIGGGSRTAELTLPGFQHDLCSAVHPLAAGSPFFRALPLDKFGLVWVEPGVPLAHPLAASQVAVLHRSLSDTAEGLGPDKRGYERLMHPLVSHWNELGPELLRPVLHFPRHPLQLARFGWRSLRSGDALVKGWFRGDEARALLAGIAAHSFLRLSQTPSAAFALLLAGVGHVVGWPFAKGGSQQISNALAAFFFSLGGEIFTGHRIEKLEQLPKSRVILLDVAPRQILHLAGDRLPQRYRRQLERFQYGPGVFKIDYALGGPIPWTARACAQAGTVHVCGTLEEVAWAEDQVAQGKHPERPFVLLAQPSLFDPTRAPEGKHIAWAYCHVPAASAVDMTGPIECQIERFAPGFRDRVLARCTTNCTQLERKNPNLVEGTISGGLPDLWQTIARPTLSFTPYRTPLKGLYLCSASTPPGGGVHGMCGFHAAEAALRDWFGSR